MPVFIGRVVMPISPSARKIMGVVRYISNQETHHKKVSFKEELLIFLRKHGVDFDEDYPIDILRIPFREGDGFFLSNPR